MGKTKVFILDLERALLKKKKGKHGAIVCESLKKHQFNHDALRDPPRPWQCRAPPGLERWPPDHSMLVSRCCIAARPPKAWPQKAAPAHQPCILVQFLSEPVNQMEILAGGPHAT